MSIVAVFPFLYFCWVTISAGATSVPEQAGMFSIVFSIGYVLLAFARFWLFIAISFVFLIACLFPIVGLWEMKKWAACLGGFIISALSFGAGAVSGGRLYSAFGVAGDATHDLEIFFQFLPLIIYSIIVLPYWKRMQPNKTS